jgi:alpha-N-arabinofuranosidase
VKMTNFTLMTSLLSADSVRGTFKSPLFHIFKAFSNNCLGTSIDTWVSCDTFSTEKYKEIPYLDVTSTYSKADGVVFINVVNRHKDKAITADISTTSGMFSGKADVSLITATDMQAPFVFDKQDQYKPVQKSIELKNNQLSASFPAHSFTQIKLSIKQK